MPIKVSKEYIEARFPQGAMLELLEQIDDPYTPKAKGERFIVSGVDDIGQIHGSWISGGSMAIDFYKDKFKIVGGDEDD